MTNQPQIKKKGWRLRNNKYWLTTYAVLKQFYITKKELIELSMVHGGDRQNVVDSMSFMHACNR